jgi:hypothetical protein
MCPAPTASMRGVRRAGLICREGQHELTDIPWLKISSLARLSHPVSQEDVQEVHLAHVEQCVKLKLEILLQQGKSLVFV